MRFPVPVWLDFRHVGRAFHYLERTAEAFRELGDRARVVVDFELRQPQRLQRRQVNVLDLLCI